MSSSSETNRQKRSIPPGILLLRCLGGKHLGVNFHRAVVLVVTFIAYTCYHASRKPPSIVSGVLHPKSTSPTVGLEYTGLSDPFPWPLNLIYIKRVDGNVSHEGVAGLGSVAQKGWAPFNRKDGSVLLGEIDMTFLAFYSFGMFFSGQLGDRSNLRLFLTVGMIGSGAFVCLFGMAYWWNIHVLWYFLFVQMMAGVFQSTGWPCVVAIVGNWFSNNKRGLIMGIWNAHTSVGNIVGSLVAASALQAGWGWSFIYPGLLIISGGVLVFLFLVVEPADLDLVSPHEANANRAIDSSNAQDLSENRALLADYESGTASNVTEEATVIGIESIHSKLQDAPDAESNVLHSAEDKTLDSQSIEAPVGFLEAWMIPGVISFSFCLFFSKLVAYTFLDWLPYYIRNTTGQYLSNQTAGNLSTLFDLGGVVGGILAGFISDKSHAKAMTAASFTYLTIPVLLLYRLFGGVSLYLNVGLMMLSGLLINGPYALITTAVSADLGTHGSLKGNARALATVTAIIDGTGSFGAALGPLLTGYLSLYGWDSVFAMLMLSVFLAGLLLTKLIRAEFKEKVERSRNLKRQASGGEDVAGSLRQPLIVAG
ncbi:hypothetical protein O6H91_09G006000 [Diphasiastrum complanatum]|uniref:Uncharacterized protein n=1 Tax=Diphasiastrum complanatum TaxID=34168 RepID=A0ACC2CKZ7_DIPCM|nr:hypothetical protein O6H91_09G006000 [Diphasiastrum complanatum]